MAENTFDLETVEGARSLLDAQKRSGLSITAWCGQAGISERQYRKARDRVRAVDESAGNVDRDAEERVEAMGSEDTPGRPRKPVRIEAEDVTIEIGGNASPGLVAALVGVLATGGGEAATRRLMRR